ncbi:MAG: GNAT family N-acetyltransferase [Candidatus Stahlbacteria bacterium]|nr:MAG: GNAT family N-acetyltransferase [Candidatus Stahlbacteria bacterium]
MEEGSAMIKLREATFKDRDGILRIASATWEGWDYVPLFLEDWIKQGGLFVAEVGGEIVGVTKTSELSPGELWLEAIRVAEEHRRKGLGREIAEEQLKLALAASPKSIRLSTADVNTASLAIIHHLGFQEYALFDYFEQREPLGTFRKVELDEKEFLAGAEVTEKAWVLVRSSEEFVASKGLLPHTWKFRNFTEELFRSLLEDGLVYVTPEVGGVLVLMRNRYTPESREIAFLEGDERSLEILSKLAQAKLASLPEGVRFLAFAASKRKHKILQHLGMKFHERVKKVYVFDYPLDKK